MMNLFKGHFLKSKWILKMNSLNKYSFMNFSRATTSTDSDLERNEKSSKNQIKKNSNEGELYDLSMIKSLNFNKVFDLGEGKEISAGESVEQNIDNFDDLRTWDIIEKMQGVENKISTLTNILIDRLHSRIETRDLIKIFSEEDLKSYLPREIANNENKNKLLKLNELNILLVYLTVNSKVIDEFNIGKYEYLINNFLSYYLHNLSKLEKISFNQFIFFIKINLELKIESLDFFIMKGLSSIFCKPMDLKTYELFAEKNPEYKDIIHILHILIKYFQELILEHQFRYSEVLNNICDSLINIHKLILTDLKSLTSLVKVLCNLKPQLFTNVKNYFTLIDIVNKTNLSLEIHSFLEFLSYAQTTMRIINLFPAYKHNFDYFEGFYQRVSEVFTTYEIEVIPIDFLNTVIHEYFLFLTTKMDAYDMKSNEKNMQYHRNLMKIFHEKFQQMKFTNLPELTLASLIKLRSIENVALVKHNKQSLQTINKLTTEFKDLVDSIESPLTLINFLKNNKSYLSFEDTQLILPRIYNKLSLLKNEPFCVLNNLLGVLLKVDLGNKQIYSVLKSDYMNKLFYAYISGKLFDKLLDIPSLLENLRNFMEQNVIKEDKNKKGVVWDVKEKMVDNADINELKNLQYTLTQNDIANIIDQVYLKLSNEYKNNYFNFSSKLAFIENLSYLTSTSIKKDELFRNYYLKVIYPLLQLNIRMITTVTEAGQYFNSLSLMSTKLAQVQNGKNLMDYHLKLIVKCLLYLIKISKYHPKQNGEILNHLNVFYRHYMFNPSAFEAVEQAKRRHQYLKFILRKRYLIGRFIKLDSPVQVLKGKEKVIDEKYTDLTDNHFF